MLLIVVRLNYMSALYFSSISFAAHKKHGGLWIPVGRAQGYPPNRPRTCRSPRCALRAAGAPPSCGKIWRVTLCPACGYYGVGAFFLRCSSAMLGGLNGTLLHWALFPDGALPEGAFRSCGEIGTVLAVKSPNQSLFHRNLYWGSLLRNLDLDYRFTVASIRTPMVTGGWYELSLLWN